MSEIRLIKKEEAVVRKISETYTISNLLTKAISEKVSVVVSESKGHSEMARNKISDRIYYVLGGQLKVKQGGKELIANSDDLIFVPANTWYEFGGSFKAVLINAPAFDPKYDEYKLLKK